MAQELGGRLRILGQEYIRFCFVIENLEPGRKQDRRRARRCRLYRFDELRSVEVGKNQIRNHQIDIAAAQVLHGLIGASATNHAVAARFQENLADGKSLFIAIGAKDSAFWFHDFPGDEIFLQNFFLRTQCGENRKCHTKACKVARKLMRLPCYTRWWEGRECREQCGRFVTTKVPRARRRKSFPLRASEGARAYMRVLRVRE